MDMTSFILGLQQGKSMGDTNGSSKIVAKTGTYTANTTGAMTITHNLGVQPDIIVVRRKDNSIDEPLRMTFVFGLSKKFLDATNFKSLTYSVGSNYTLWGESSTGMDQDGAAGISNVTATTFTVGGVLIPHISGETYAYQIVGGLV